MKEDILKEQISDRLFTCFCFLKVIRRLRERGEPIRLFGESDEEACQRLRSIYCVHYIWND